MPWANICKPFRLTRLRGFETVATFFAAQVVDNQQGLPRKTPESAVVQTYPIPKLEKRSIMQRHHVSALQQTAQGWQGASLLEHRRKQTRGRREDRPASCALFGGNQ